MLLAEFSIRAGVTEIPAELLRLNLHDHGVLGVGKLLDVFPPEWNGNPEQQPGFDEDDCELGVFRELAVGTFVAGLGVALGVKAPEGVAEICDPADEEDEHQPMNPDHEVVNGLRFDGGAGGEAEEVVGKPVVHTLEIVSVEFWAAAASAALLRKIKIRNAPNVSNTVPMTPIRVKMPRFMPSVMGDSMLPP